MAEIRKYSISENRIRKSLLEGFYYKSHNTLKLNPKKRVHRVFLPAICAAEKEHMWGRISFEKILDENSELYVYAMASDEKGMNEYILDADIAVKEKKEFFIKHNGIVVSKSSDILLYDVKGRYLWVLIEISGALEGEIRNIVIDSTGDNFMMTFPEIYWDKGGFFHRYMSIFSSIYNDFQCEIDTSYQQLDLKTAPQSLLVMYGKWLGLSIEEGVLDDEILRSLISNLYCLNGVKGTRGALLKLIKILTGEEAIIIERNLLTDSGSNSEQRLYDKLYGKSKRNITLLISNKSKGGAGGRLQFLVNQFIPIRSKLTIIFYDVCCNMDSYCYMDMNAKLYEVPDTVLDSTAMLGEGMHILS